MAEEEDNEWLSSKIKGFSFGDDDETPFEELAKHQRQTVSRSSGGQEEFVISFDSDANFSASSSSRVVSDRVRAASSAYASHLDRVEKGGQSISDVVGQENQTEIMSNDPKTLRAELSQARRTVEKINLTRFTPLHPKETIRNLFFGRSFSLEFYKSWNDKLALIDEALILGDGNAVLAVALFLRRTLSRRKFLEALATRPAAMRQIVSYLTARGELTDAVDILSGLGRYQEAGLIVYQRALAESGRDGGFEAKIQRLKSALSSSQLSNHPDHAHLSEHIHLLERVSPVYAADMKNPEILAKLQQPGVPAIDPNGVTVMRVLLYCAYHHWREGENLLHSPLSVKKLHKLNERQFTWIGLIARARRFQWKDCEELTVTKSWLGGKKTKSAIQPERIVQILHENGAPTDILQPYLLLIESIEDREVLAKKVGAHNVVIDIYVAQKDRAGLTNYKSRLVANSSEWLYADNALNVSNTRWKN